MATTVDRSPRCIAGMTFSVAILAAPRTPHRNVVIFFSVAQHRSCTSRASRSFLRGSDFYQHGAMTRHGRAELVRRFRQILVHPEIAYGLAARESDVRELHRDVRRFRTTVEESDRHRAVGKRARPDVGAAVADQPARGFAQHVLIYR